MHKQRDFNGGCHLLGAALGLTLLRQFVAARLQLLVALVRGVDAVLAVGQLLPRLQELLLVDVTGAGHLHAVLLHRL